MHRTAPVAHRRLQHCQPPSTAAPLGQAAAARGSPAPPASSAVVGGRRPPARLRLRTLSSFGVFLAALLPATHTSAVRFDAPIPETVDYGPLGKVTTTRDWYHPRYRVFNPTPRPREQVNTTITLYTRLLGQQGVLVWPQQWNSSVETRGSSMNANIVPTTTEAAVQKSKWASPVALSENVNCSLPVRVIVHGWRGAASTWMKEMMTEFLKREPCSVFIVLWEGEVNYFQATQDIRVVAMEVAALLKQLTVSCGLRASDVHLIGHSLGAHICGYVGQRVPGIRRITGLDPADPSYTYMPEFVRLDPTDATFVDVIHTDSQSILGSGLGMRLPVGHLDFFPNAGRYQPGCELWKVPVDALSKGVVSAAADFTVCSHSRAPSLFTESINSYCRFIAFRCASYMDMHSGECATCGENMDRCAIMGMDADKFIPKQRRVSNVSYFLTTANEAPFCQYPYAVTVFPGGSDNTSQWGHLTVQLRGTSGTVNELHLTENDDLTGPLPVVGIRVPNPLRRVAAATAAASLGPRELAPGRPLRLVGWSRNFTGRTVQSAALRWEHVDRAPLRRLIPCFFRCSYPVAVERVLVRTFPHPLQETDNELCPEGGKETVEIESHSSATLSQGCPVQPRRRQPRTRPPPEALDHVARLRPRGARARLSLRGRSLPALSVPPLPPHLPLPGRPPPRRRRLRRTRRS